MTQYLLNTFVKKIPTWKVGQVVDTFNEHSGGTCQVQ